MVSSNALNLLHQAMHTVSYRPIAMAIETASKLGVFFQSRFFACCPGGRRGNTERVVDQWRRPVVGSPVHSFPPFFFWRTPFSYFFLFWRELQTPKNRQTPNKERPFFCQDDNPPPAIVAIFRLISSSAGRSIAKLATVSARTIQ